MIVTPENHPKTVVTTETKVPIVQTYKNKATADKLLSIPTHTTARTEFSQARPCLQSKKKKF